MQISVKSRKVTEKPEEIEELQLYNEEEWRIRQMFLSQTTFTVLNNSLLNNDILYGSLQKRKNIKIFHTHTHTEWSMHEQ